MNNYTDLNEEYIDSTEIYNKALDISKYLINLRDSLSKINNNIDNLNDEKVWHSPASNYLKERYIKEKNNLELVYNELLNYLKHLFKVSALTEEMQRKVEKIIEQVEIKTLWNI